MRLRPRSLDRHRLDVAGGLLTLAVALGAGTLACGQRPAHPAEEPAAATHPLDAAARRALSDHFARDVAELDTKLRELAARPEGKRSTAEEIALRSRRGDALFFAARFKEAVADYERMVALDPTLAPSHWRRGIAYFYAERYADAARQFESYHSHDNVDRENGIWRYLSQVKAYGRERARKELLKYEKDDREPFGDVYRLFAGTIEAKAILERIASAEITDSEREKRRFYAHLYIGLEATVERREGEALEHLRAAVANRWGPEGGFGPSWMWHVGRVHYELLLARRARSERAAPTGGSRE